MGAGGVRDGDLFLEVQWFRTQGLVIIVWVIALLVWYGFYLQIITGTPFGSNPGSDLVMWIIMAAFGIGLPAFFLLLRLEVIVGSGRLSYRMYPVHLQFREVSCREMRLAEAVFYRPLRDYGGWGVRRGREGPAYMVSGNRGVRISLADGTSLLIGSGRADEFAGVLSGCISVYG